MGVRTAGQGRDHGDRCELDYRFRTDTKAANGQDKAGVPTASSARGADIVLQPVEKCSVSTDQWARIARQEADGGCGEVVDPAWWKQCLQTGMMHITPKMESMPWRTI